MTDELPHATIQMNRKREYMKNYIDPAGFDITEKAFSNNYAGTIGRQFGEGFTTGDALTACNIYLQVVAETAFTNTLFVAMPSEAAANGDYLLPTVFLSVQSDESRHMNNGYGALLMALAHDENKDLIERDMRYAWWNNHAVVDAAIGTFIDYGSKDRRKDRESYAEMWKRWVYDDYYRSYLVPLEKYGMNVPHDLIEESWDRVWNKWYVHYVAQFFATGWFANYWRIDPMTEEDFEWFEHKYPGWYNKFGKWWEHYRNLSEPNGHKPIAFEDTGYVYPHRRWTRMVPRLIRADTAPAPPAARRAERPQADSGRGHRLRVSEPLLGLHGAVPDPRGHRPRPRRRRVADLLLGYLPLDGPGRLPRGVQRSADARHGPAHRQARVGDPVPRLGSGRRPQGSRIRPQRRPHPGPAAARPIRPVEDVDAGPREGHRVPEPARVAQRDVGRRTREVVRGVQEGLHHQGAQLAPSLAWPDRPGP